MGYAVDTSMLPADRATVWNPGMMSAGGIPNRTTICATINAATYGNGASDASSGIQSALDSCPGGQVVKLSSGIFSVNNLLLIHSSITLRGAGPTLTILQKSDGVVARSTSLVSGTSVYTPIDPGSYSYNAQPIIIIGPSRYPSSDASTSVNLTVDGTQGTSTVTVSNASGFAAGQFVMLDELSGASWKDTPAGFPSSAKVWAGDRVVWNMHWPQQQFLDDSGNADASGPYDVTPGDTPAAMSWFSRTNRPTCEIKEVLSVSGSTITFTTPLHISYRTSHTAQLTRYTLSGGTSGSNSIHVKNAGVEDLAVKGGADGQIRFEAAAYSWAKNIDSSQWLGEGFAVDSSFRIEIRDSYIHKGSWPEPGGGGYAISFAQGSSEVLVENNAILDSCKMMVVRSCGAGSVFGYNYTDDAWDFDNPVWVEVGINASHMAGPHHVLFEGNYAQNADSDYTHGNAIYLTFLRNWLSGKRKSFPDVSTNSRAVGLAYGSWWDTFIGNVLGRSGQMSGWVYDDPSMAAGTASWRNKDIWEIGYDPERFTMVPDTQTLTTLMRGGNYDFLNNQTVWTSSVPAQTIPPSFYLSSKPAFFGNTPWPPVGPDVANFTNILPAQSCVEQGLMPDCLSALNTGIRVFGTDGGFKLAQEDVYPYNVSSMTVTRNWDGTTLKAFGAKNETIGFGLYVVNPSTTDTTLMSVSISSFTGPLGYGISSVAVSSANVMDFSNRPIEEFFVRYLRVDGLTQNYWDPTEYNEQSVPQRMRRPFTLGASSQATPSGWWIDRPDHDKLYPDIMVPYEAIAPSSFTVYASSSQLIFFDVYASSLLASGTYYALATVKQGVNISTQVPVQLLIYNFKLPDQPTYKGITYFSTYNVNYRHEGDHFPSPAQDVQTTRDRYAQGLKRHKMTVIGDSASNCCTACSSHKPCPEFEQRLSGTLYTATSGYYNAPGVGTGDPFYAVGTYGGWKSALWSSMTVTNGSTGFCDNVKAWDDWFASNYPNTRSALYIADEPTLTSPIQNTFANVEKYANWMATSTVCQNSTYHMNSLVTISLPDASSYTPHVNLPVGTEFMRASSTTWDTLNTQYQTTGSTQGWRYNGSPLASAAAYALDEDGIAGLEIAMADFKKHVPAHFYWESAYYHDTNESGRANDLFNSALTFGFLNKYIVFTVSGMTVQPTCDYTDASARQYQVSVSSFNVSTPFSGSLYMINNASFGSPPDPLTSGTLTKVAATCGGSACSCVGDATISYSASTTTLVHLVKGRTGFHHSNGDGVLIYPGKDVVVDTANSYGWDGPIASLRLKMIRKGISLYEYAAMANAVVPSSVTAIVDSLVPKSLWDNQCFSLADCSYGYGDRSWSNDPNVWETGREQLAILASGAPDISPSSTRHIKRGTSRLSGAAIHR